MKKVFFFKQKRSGSTLVWKNKMHHAVFNSCYRDVPHIQGKAIYSDIRRWTTYETQSSETAGSNSKNRVYSNATCCRVGSLVYICFEHSSTLFV